MPASRQVRSLKEQFLPLLSTNAHGDRSFNTLVNGSLLRLACTCCFDTHQYTHACWPGWNRERTCGSYLWLGETTTLVLADDKSPTIHYGGSTFGVIYPLGTNSKAVVRVAKSKAVVRVAAPVVVQETTPGLPHVHLFPAVTERPSRIGRHAVYVCGEGADTPM